MDPDRKLRKRATDRECQRASRVRKREKVARLESLVQGITGTASSEERHVYLTNKLLEQEQEIAVLQRTLLSISKLSSSQAHAPAESNLLDATTSVQPEVRDQGILQLEARQQPENTPGMSDDPGASHFLGYDLSCTSDRNYYAVLNTIMRDMERSPKQFFNLGRAGPMGQSEDDDMIIRCVVEGWGVVEKKYSLDIGWLLLRAMHNAVLSRAGPMERLVSMKLVRSMILMKLDRRPERAAALPHFMAKTIAQDVIEHDSLIDYFPWPAFRDALIFSSEVNITGPMVSMFVDAIRFHWPYEFRDSYNKTVASDTYRFSDAFWGHYNDVDSYRIHLPLLSAFPTLAGIAPPDVPTSLASSACQSREQNHELL